MNRCRRRKQKARARWRKLFARWSHPNACTYAAQPFPFEAVTLESIRESMAKIRERFEPALRLQRLIDDYTTPAILLDFDPTKHETEDDGLAFFGRFPLHLPGGRR